MIESTVLTTFRDPGRERMVPPYPDVESQHKRGVAQPGSARALGARGRGFESRRPDLSTSVASSTRSDGRAGGSQPYPRDGIQEERFAAVGTPVSHHPVVDVREDVQYRILDAALRQELLRGHGVFAQLLISPVAVVAESVKRDLVRAHQRLSWGLPVGGVEGREPAGL